MSEAVEGSGPALDTASGDVVSINVNPDGPYGIGLKAFSDGNAAVVTSFERLPNGRSYNCGYDSNTRCRIDYLVCLCR